jgi:hypothetical protein
MADVTGARRFTARIGGLVIGLAAPVVIFLACAPPTQARALCPSSDTPRLVSRRSGAQHELVPGGARQILLCRYNDLGPSGDPGRVSRLVAWRLVNNAAATARFGRDLDALKPQRFPIACPAGTGVTTIIAFFRYPTQPDDPVTLIQEGCWNASNGRLTRGETGTVPDIFAAFTSLTPATSR